MSLIKSGKKENNRKSGALAAHKQTLRADALGRQAAYDALTVDQKIAALEANGFTATKQRAKLIAQKGKK